MAGALERIKARHTTYPTDEGTFLHDAFYPVAEEVDEVLDVDIPEAFDRHMVDTADGADLDRLAAMVGVYRKSAAKATGALRISGAVGTPVPAGTLYSTDSGMLYVTTETVTILPNGTVSADAEAVAPGVAGNTPANTIIRRVAALTGVTGVTNPVTFGGGAEAETDALLRERVLDRLRNPPASGSVRDYVRWAKEVPGVEGAKCLERWDGPGTIKVVIAGAGMGPADAEVVGACFLHIDEHRPAGGPVLTVVSATPVIIGIEAAVTLQAGYTAEAVVNAFLPVFTAWLHHQAFSSIYISHAQVGKLLASMPGVTDYDSATLLINGAFGNLALVGTAVPVAGTVTLHG